MAALTAGRRVTQKGDLALPSYMDVPQKAGVLIYPGAMVALNGGYLDNAAANTALQVLGIYDGPTTSDNTLGSNGSIYARVRFGEMGIISGTGGDTIAQANVGQPCYVIDNQTVGLTSAGGTRPVAGTILEIDPQFPTLVFVNMGAPVGAFGPAAPMLQSGTATLVAGTVTVSAGVSITASSKVLLSLNTPGGATQGVKYKAPTASLVVGAPGAGAFVITATDNTGATVATDVSTVNYLIVG